MKVKLRDVREEKDITQEEMSKLLEISTVSYHLYETGQRKIPKEKAVQIASILGVEVEDFFTPVSFSIR